MTVTTALAGNLVPVSFRFVSASRTVFSISRWAVTQSFLKNLRREAPWEARASNESFSRVGSRRDLSDRHYGIGLLSFRIAQVWNAWGRRGAVVALRTGNVNLFNAFEDVRCAPTSNVVQRGPCRSCLKGTWPPESLLANAPSQESRAHGGAAFCA